MIRPQIFTAKLADRIDLNPRFHHFYLELVHQPDVIEFEAGQYISLSLPDGSQERRSYSICSAPEKNHGFEMLIDYKPQGKGTKYLENLQFGEEIQFLAPMGLFTISTEVASNTLVLIANGSGIAPYRAMLQDQLQQKHNKNSITLYWGVRHEDELFWLDEFEELMDAFPNFQFHPVVSQAGDVWSLCRGRVTDCLSVHQLPENAEYFLCGSNPMIESVLKIFEQKAIPKEKIHREKFY